MQGWQGSETEANAESAREAASAFGFAPSIEMTSLCPYAPVYRIKAEGQDLVLKRTGYPRSSATAIANWLHALRDREADVVAPVPGYEPNPRVIHPFDKWSWVLYPFVEGRAYAQTPSDLRSSGRLLGQIHAKGADLGRGMFSLTGIPSPDQQKVATHLATSVDQLAQWRPDVVKMFQDKVAGHLESCRGLRPQARSLPCAAGSWDFKASNLVFSRNEAAILVDPDHAGRLPRVYDAACAALLFHCDLRPSPRTLWSANQWSEFYSGYSEHIVWLPEERAAWSEALAAAWLDEGLWLLAHFSEGWEREGERQYLVDLALVDFERFRLP
ncbi:hypothetical protein RZS28_03405 [Methylocapsa polymorpha]|uniref:Aminoglycoside phosphotransferase domain-containing protein n=1 Tax=Methylocapsa polymorpha TaxID=3080828 RepID=A0ABZ0HT39_9HYPH|nr:hypothetical protein RZS28_03405 [Methylocapsa sp. RX1]